ncbi:MAG: hypothetical protein U9N59_06980 [Campylobacterota bacterium]|nr:hypothetical protein [Campylobacterota bacterium]
MQLGEQFYRFFKKLDKTVAKDIYYKFKGDETPKVNISFYFDEKTNKITIDKIILNAYGTFLKNISNNFIK